MPTGNNLSIRSRTLKNSMAECLHKNKTCIKVTFCHILFKFYHSEEKKRLHSTYTYNFAPESVKIEQSHLSQYYPVATTAQNIRARGIFLHVSPMVDPFFCYCLDGPSGYVRRLYLSGRQT